MQAVTHVGGFLVWRQVELLFLCPQVLLCLITVGLCSNVWQFSPDMCYFGKYFSVLKLLLWFAELFAFTGSYKTCVLQVCWNSDSSLKINSQISLSIEKCFLVSLWEKRSLKLCGWLGIEDCVYLLLNYITSSCCFKQFILAAKQAFLPSDTCIISSPPGMQFHIPSCPIPRVYSSVS